MEIDQRGNVIIEYFPMKPEKSLAIFMQSAESGSDGKIADKVWRRVGQDVVQKARAYLVKNGSYITGDLYNSVKANVDKGQLELIADAKNDMDMHMEEVLNTDLFIIIVKHLLMQNHF